MELLKTPHQMLLEEAGQTPASQSMLNTPKQMLMQESGIMPHFAQGGSLSPQDMLAAIIAHGQEPQHFQKGGSSEKMTFNIGKNIGDRVNALTDDEIREYLKRAGHKITDYKTVPPRPNTEFGPFEHTAVVSTRGNPQNLADKTWAMSQALQQQAIPVQTPTQKLLAGPSAQDWGGAFSPQHFVPQHGVQAAGNKASLMDKTREFGNKAMLAAKSPIESGVMGKVGSVAGKGLMGLGGLGIAADAAENVQQNNPGGVALNALDLKALLSLNPGWALASGLLSPSPLGKGTLDEYRQKNGLEQSVDKYYNP
jgi:hypothetical protein